jgi:hypothetical protein
MECESPVPDPAIDENDVIPRLTDLPRESAVEMNETAARILSAVREWSRGVGVAADYDTAARFRRVLKPVVATIARRKLSGRSTADANEAARIIDRVLGLAITAGEDAGKVGPASKGTGPSIRDLTGGDPIRPLYRLADLSEQQFDAALARSRAHGGQCSLDSVIWALDAAADETPPPVVEAPPAPRDVNVYRVVADALMEISAVATLVAQLEPDDIDQLDAACAKDYARGLWEVLVPVMALHNALRTRGRSA